jgi:SAM-dependent methyltransferase
MADEKTRPAFDEFAHNYDEALREGLSITGEGRDYFAQRRVQWFAGRLATVATAAHSLVIDYGCGTGSTAPLLHDELKADQVVGLDVSGDELAIARRDYPHGWARFLQISEYVPDATADVVYCNGTFHHIPPQNRHATVRYILDCLKPGGIFALWENNPWNPGTKTVMSRIPFDRDAITLSIGESRRLLQAGAFEILRTETLFYFPRQLAFLRPLERLLSRLPFGGQYLVLARKPTTAAAGCTDC